MTTSAVIAGVGQTEFSKNSGRSSVRLAVEAAGEALSDAGLSASAIDAVIPSHFGVTAEDIAGSLGVGDLRYSATSYMGGASAVASLQLASAAVTSGRASVCLVLVARNASSETRVANRVAVGGPGHNFRSSLEWPAGLSTPSQWYSLICRRYMHEYGLTREQLGAVALTTRQHALLNPHAQMYGRPLTMAQYLDAPPIAEPYHLFDCSLETDGGSAVLVTSAERAADMAGIPVAIAGIGEGRPSPSDDLASRKNFFDTGVRAAARRALAEAGMDLSGISGACIYDCFTFQVIQQLEEIGYCERGEGSSFFEGGGGKLGSRLPINPHGGLLSEGHLSGMNHVVEAVRQVRGDCGERQISGAQSMLVTGWGELGNGSVAILTR